MESAIILTKWFYDQFKSDKLNSLLVIAMCIISWDPLVPPGSYKIATIHS